MVNYARRQLRRMPWYASVALVAAGVAGVAGFSYVFTSDLFNETCVNERNLLTGEYAPSNCGEGAKVARQLGSAPEAPTDVPMSSDATPTPEPSQAPTEASTPSTEASPTPTPETATPNTTEGAAPGVLARGVFQDGEPGHDGSGNVEIQRLADGGLNVFLSDFSVTNGPDLFVVLTRDPGGNYAEGDLVLEALKGNNGNQNYAVPAGVDVSQFGAVLIWCRAFDVEFAFAALGGAE